MTDTISSESSADFTHSAVANTQNISKEDVENTVKMSDKDIKWRAKYKLTKEELEMLAVKSEKERTTLQSMIDQATKEKQRVEQNLIDAKLENAAIQAGISDIDLVKLIDRSGIKADESGQFIGVKEAVEAFKASKPAFFGEQRKSSTSTNAQMPSNHKPSVEHVSRLSAAEWNKQKAALKSGKIL